MADTNTYNKYNQPKKVISQAKFDALDKTSIPIGSEYDIVGPILESDLDSNILTKLNNNAKINTQNTFTQQQNFNKGIVVTGNITLNGDIVKTTTEELFVKDAIIHTRAGATAGLADNEYTGIQATKYDGTNDGQLVFDKNGIARVGDIGDTQPLATRSESADLLNNHLLKWDSTNNKLIDSGKTIDDFQSKLVSGTNIKTINGNSILGSGDLTISTGSSVNVVQTTGNSETDVMSQKAATDNFLNTTVREGSGKYITEFSEFQNIVVFDKSPYLTAGLNLVGDFQYGLGSLAPIIKAPEESGRMSVEPNDLPTETSLVTVSSTGTHAYKKVSELVAVENVTYPLGADYPIKSGIEYSGNDDAYIKIYSANNYIKVRRNEISIGGSDAIYLTNNLNISGENAALYCKQYHAIFDAGDVIFDLPALPGNYFFAPTPNAAPTEPSVVVNATDRTPAWKPVSELGGNALKVTVW